MKNKLLPFITLIIFFRISNVIATEHASTYVFTGIQNVSQIFIVESFNPLTHYEKGDLSISIMPIYMKINHVRTHENSINKYILEGDGFSGYSIGGTINYAINQKWYINLSSTYIKSDGSLISTTTFKGTGLDPDKAHLSGKAETQLYSFGLGYDISSLFSGKNKSSFSFPVTGGIHYRKISGEFTGIPESEIGYIPPYIVEADESGMGIFIVFSPSYMFKIFNSTCKITPYLYLFSTREIEADVYERDNPGLVRQYAVHPPNNIFPALSLTYLTGTPWSFSLSISGWFFSQLNTYNDRFLDGLMMRSFSLTVSYDVNIF